MQFLKISAAAGALIALAACGGGTTAGGGGGGGGGGASFNSLASQFNSIGAGTGFVDDSDVDGTLFAELPTSGSASYSGVMAVVVGDTDTLGLDAEETDQFAVSDADALGEVTVNANFGAKTITGTATNFRDQDNGAISGTLTMSGGEISDVVGTALYGGDASGRLTDSDGDTYTLNDGAFIGGFVGGTGTTFGVVAGDVSSTVAGVNAMAGVYVADKN